MKIKSRIRYNIIGGDFSAQEPRLTAFYSKDENMRNAYLEGKDLYSFIASLMFDNAYEDNLEFYPEGTKIMFDGKEITCGYKDTTNVEGKERRTQAKRVLLGLLYGRGPASIGAQINKSKQEAQEIIDKFFNAFPSVYQWIEDTKKQAQTTYMVEDWCGRIRHLPVFALPDFEAYSYHTDSKGNKIKDIPFNPLLDCEDTDVSPNPKLQKYLTMVGKCKGRQAQERVISEAEKDGVLIIPHTSQKSKALRQSVNSRVQGGAASLTKKAMISIANDEFLKTHDFHMEILVHDEIIGEAPVLYGEEVAKRLARVMIDSAAEYIDIPMSVDTYNVSNWYLDEYASVLKKEITKYQKSGMSYEEAFDKLVSLHTENTREMLEQIIAEQ